MCRYFLREPVKIISNGRIGKSKVALLTAAIRYNNVNMSTYSTLSNDHIPIKVLRGPVKVTVNALATGCQSFYRKIYGHFLQCTRVSALERVSISFDVIGSDKQ